MVRDEEVRNAVENARALLSGIGYECGTTMDEFLLWFQADTPYDQGDEFEQVIRNPLYVAHELVEIEKVKAMGLKLTKDVIVKNMQKVDDAHLEAMRVELRLALSLRDVRHVEERIRHIGMYLDDPSVTPRNKMEYADLREQTKQALEALRPDAGE